MKARLFFYFLFTMCFYSGYSQPSPMPKEGGFKVLWGPEYKFPKKYVDLSYVGDRKEGFVQLSLKYGKEIVLQGFDANLKMTKEKRISIKNLPKSFVSEGFHTAAGRYFWLYSTWEKSKEKEQLYAQEIDVKGPGFIGKPTLLVEVSGKVTGSSIVQKGMYSFDVAGKFNRYYSLDSGKVMVVYRKAPQEKDDAKNKDKIGFAVFNNALEKEWTKELKMPYTEKKMDNKDYMVDGSGNAYVLAKINDVAPKDKTKPNYEFQVLKYPNGGGDGKDVTKIPITLDKYFILDVGITEDFNGNIVCAGYYSIEAPKALGAKIAAQMFNVYTGPNSKTDGSFITKIDTAGSAINVNKGYYEIPNELMKQYESDRIQKKMDEKEASGASTVYNLELKDVVLYEDGSILLIGEQFETVSHKSSSYGSNLSFLYDDIYAMKVSPSGEMEWINKIPKKQSANNCTCDLSYKLFLNDDDVYLLFMDNAKNLKIKPDAAPAGHVGGLGGILVYVKIDEKGVVSKDKIFDVRDKGVRMWPVDFARSGENAMVNRAIRSGVSSKVVMISLEE